MEKPNNNDLTFYQGYRGEEKEKLINNLLERFDRKIPEAYLGLIKKAEFVEIESNFSETLTISMAGEEGWRLLSSDEINDLREKGVLTNFGEKILQIVSNKDTIVDIAGGHGMAPFPSSMAELAVTAKVKKYITVDKNVYPSVERLFDTFRYAIKSDMLEFVSKMPDKFTDTFFLSGIDPINISAENYLEYLAIEMKRTLKDDGHIISCVTPGFEMDHTISKLFQEDFNAEDISKKLQSPYTVRVYKKE